MARWKVLAVGLLTSALVATGGGIAHADHTAPIGVGGTGGAEPIVEKAKCMVGEASYPWKDVPPNC